MEINFYEEYPTKENLERLTLIKFRCKIFIAARSFDEFKKYSKKAKTINRKIKTAYWPIIKNSYWISPFSNTQDLVELFNELEKTDCDLLIDLEPPMINKKLFLKNLLFFFRNKKIINKFLEKNKKRISTFGLYHHVDTEKHLMFYTGTLSKIILLRTVKVARRLKDKSKVSAALGTIAPGVLGNETTISSKQLEEDFNFMIKEGFTKFVIFRLGGLNKEYMDVINKVLKRSKLSAR